GQYGRRLQLRARRHAVRGARAGGREGGHRREDRTGSRGVAGMRVEHGDCLEVMMDLILEGVQVDSVVTDPPYHLTSIVNRFGKPGSAPARSNGATGVYKRASAGFMGKQWDGGNIAANPETWSLAYELLKPGGYLLAFGGTRTYHRMVCAIEDAGFEIRDSIDWLYSIGFPKSINISKEINKRSGVETTDEAKRWEGWGTALKPAREPIVVARKPFEGPLYRNVLKYGTGGMNIDACRVAPSGDKIAYMSGAAVLGGTSDGLDRPWKNNPEAVAERERQAKEATDKANNMGRWPANIILTHSADCKIVGQEETKARVINRWNDGAKPFGGGAGHEFTTHQTSEDGNERYDIYECVEGCPAKLLDEQSGIAKPKA